MSVTLSPFLLLGNWKSIFQRSQWPYVAYNHLPDFHRSLNRCVQTQTQSLSTRLSLLSHSTSALHWLQSALPLRLMMLCIFPTSLKYLIPQLHQISSIHSIYLLSEMIDPFNDTSCTGITPFVPIFPYTT